MGRLFSNDDDTRRRRRQQQQPTTTTNQQETRMTSVQLSTKTLSATLLLVLILGSVLCPPCKARQLMQTPEERIDALCDNIVNKLKKGLDQLGGAQYAVAVNVIQGATDRINVEANAGNLKDEIRYILVHGSMSREAF